MLTLADGTLAVVVRPYDPSWPDAFAALATVLRTALVGRPADLHHIGSTAVPGLAAKPRLDVQVSVPDLAAADQCLVLLAGGPLGLARSPGNTDRRKRFLSSSDPVPVNVHVRVRGEFSQQAALLLRDYLRADDAARDRYAGVKQRLAGRAWVSVDAYADAKGDVVWALLREADRWAAGIGWTPPPSDA